MWSGWQFGSHPSGQAPGSGANVVVTDTAVDVVTEIVTVTAGGPPSAVATAFSTVTSQAKPSTSATSIVSSTTSPAPVPVTTSTSTLKQDPSQGPYSPANLQAAILDSTNHYRQLHSAPPLVWNATIAAITQAYTEKCLWKHSGNPYGENLAGNYDSPAHAVDGWASEAKSYNYAAPGFTEGTGHFTQLVWKSTTSVGCAVTNCNNQAPDGAKGWFLVCDYYPPGNFVDDFAKNVAPASDGSKKKVKSRSVTSGGERRWTSASGLATLGLVLSAILAV